MEIARRLGVRFVVNMSKVRFVRVSNKPIKRISWEEYLRIIPKKNAPGIHLPFDVEASKLAERNHIKVVFENRPDKIKTFNFKFARNNGTIIR